MIPRSSKRRSAHSAGHLTLFFLAAFAVLAFALGYWTLVAQGSLLARTDNPRALIAFNRIQRGPILDRRGRPMAESTGQPGDYVRRYELSSAHIVGYASFRYGLSGVEDAADAALTGVADQDSLSQWWRYDVLGEAQVGDTVQLTIDLDLQRAAFDALDGRPGAIVILDTASGDILAMASSPSFDPAQIETAFETFTEDSNGPLISRATLGLYQADTLLKRFPRTLDLSQTPQLSIPVQPAEGGRLTPLHMALLVAATGNSGLMPAPRLILEQPAMGHPVPVLPAPEAAPLAIGFYPGLALTIPSGFEDETLGWFVELTPDSRLVLCIVLENATARQAADTALGLRDSLVSWSP